MKTARQIAVEALGKVNGSKGYSNIVIDKALEQSGLDLRDAAFATALFYGVLERMLTFGPLHRRVFQNPGGKTHSPGAGDPAGQPVPDTVYGFGA